MVIAFARVGSDRPASLQFTEHDGSQSTERHEERRFGAKRHGPGRKRVAPREMKFFAGFSRPVLASSTRTTPARSVT